MKTSKYFILILLIIDFISYSDNNIYAQDNDSTQKYSTPKIVVLNLDSLEYQRIFEGEKEGVLFHSGYVILGVNESIGAHNTKDYEEMIIVLEGEGEMIISGGSVLNLKYGIIGYCPPNTEHNIKNIGSSYMKYIYVAAKSNLK
jgi:mannose-6-phosphate isomerase-like protein (cupin superfamily)